MPHHPSKQDIKLAVDNCIFTVEQGELRLLLIQMKKTPFAGQWALPGGLVKEDEDLDAAAKRVLLEETAVKDVYLEQLYTFGGKNRDPRGRVVSVAYFALIPTAGIRLHTIDKYSDVRWWPASKLPPLAYDHKEISDYAKQRLIWKVSYSNVVWSLLPPKFTLSQLQIVYEAILGKTLDKRNFRKKIDKIGLVIPVGEKAAWGAHRPAMLYKFENKKMALVEML